jgi:hypothetical protein
VLLAMGHGSPRTAPFYIYSAFVLTYWTQQLKMPRAADPETRMLFAAIWRAGGDFRFFGALSDSALAAGPCTSVWRRHDRRARLFRSSGSWNRLGPAHDRSHVRVFMFSHAPMYGPQAAFLSEMFGTRVRYSGASLGAQLASVAGGGLSPIIAARCFVATDGAPSRGTSSSWRQSRSWQ